MAPRESYTTAEPRVQAALSDLAAGMRIPDAARKHNVSAKRLRNRCKGIPSMAYNGGNNKRVNGHRGDKTGIRRVPKRTKPFYLTK